MIRNQIRTFNKHVANKLLRGLTSLSYGPFAIMRHVGRRSGRPYETVLMVWPLREGFMVVLTYGPEVDWLRNIRASEGCTLLWHKKIYTVGKPEPIDAETALPALPKAFRPILRKLDFIWMKTVTSEPATLSS